MKQFLEAGEFVTTHGIMGELKLYPWADDAFFLLEIPKLYLDEDGKRVVVVEKIRAVKNMDILKLKDINSIEEARPFIGKTVWINRDDIVLEGGQFFVEDLLGAKVVHAETAQEYGVVKNVLHPGKHDVYEIEGVEGETYLFPAVDEFLVERDLANGVVRILPIEGMFEKEEKKEKPAKKYKRK